MRIFFAEAFGVIGRHLLPMLVDAGHTVGAMTRSATKAGPLATAGAQAIVGDVFDRPSLTNAVRAFKPHLILHELTDLSDDLKDLPVDSSLNARIPPVRCWTLSSAGAASDVGATDRNSPSRINNTSAQSTPSISSTAAAVTLARVSSIGVAPRAKLRMSCAMVERIASSYSSGVT